MLFTGSLFPFTCYLQAPFFDLHVIYRLPFSIYMFFMGSFFDFHVIYRLPFSIYMLFTGSLFWFTRYLQAPVFIFHVIYSLPFFKLNVVYSLPFFIYMLFTVLWQPPCIKFTSYLRVSRLNHKKFTGYLQYLQEQFTCYLLDLSPLLWNIYSVFFIIYMLHLKYLLVFYMKPPKHVKGKNHVNYSLQSLLDYLHVNYMLFTYSVNFQLFQCLLKT